MTGRRPLADLPARVAPAGGQRDYPGQGGDAEAEEDRYAECQRQPGDTGGQSDESRATDHPQVAKADHLGQAPAWPCRIGPAAGQEYLRGDARQAGAEHSEPGHCTGWLAG